MATIQKMVGQVVFPTQKQVLPAQDCRQMRSGTPLQALHKLGTALLGLRQQQVVSTTLQAQVNADTNVRQITLGQIQSAKLIPKFQTVQDFQVEPCGIQFQQLHRRGTVLRGHRQQPEHTIQLQVRFNADINAMRIIYAWERNVFQNATCLE